MQVPNGDGSSLRRPWPTHGTWRGAAAERGDRSPIHGQHGWIALRRNVGGVRVGARYVFVFVCMACVCSWATTFGTSRLLIHAGMDERSCGATRQRLHVNCCTKVCFFVVRAREGAVLHGDFGRRSASGLEVGHAMSSTRCCSAVPLCPPAAAAMFFSLHVSVHT